MNVVRCALNVLECPEPEGKARLSQEYLSAWSNGEISCEDMTYLDGLVPDRPARTDDKVEELITGLIVGLSAVTIFPMFATR